VTLDRKPPSKDTGQQTGQSRNEKHTPPGLPDIWTLRMSYMEFEDMEYPHFHVGYLTQFAIMASPTGWSTERPPDWVDEPSNTTHWSISWPVAPLGGLFVQPEGTGRWATKLDDHGRYRVAGTVVAVPKRDFFWQDACECWSPMPNCLLDCGIVIMARLYQPGEHTYRVDCGQTETRGLLRPTVGDFVSGEVFLDIHIPELRGVPPCIYTWRITGLKGRDNEHLTSTTKGETELVSARLTRAEPLRERDDLAVVLLPMSPAPRHVRLIMQAAGVDRHESERLLTQAPVPLRSRLTQDEARRLMAKLEEAGILAAISYVPRRPSGRDVRFRPGKTWDYGPDDYIPRVTWEP